MGWDSSDVEHLTSSTGLAVLPELPFPFSLFLPRNSPSTISPVSSRGSPCRSPDREAGGARREHGRSALFSKSEKSVEGDKVSEGSLPGQLRTKDESWCYSGSESGRPLNSFGLFLGYSKGTWREGFGRIKNKITIHLRGAVREGGEGCRCPLFSSNSVWFHPGFSGLPGVRVGWGGVGWRTTGSGPAGVVGDPGMLGFRVRAG